MPKRNLIWIAAIVAAAGVTMWVTRSDRPQPGPDGEGRLDDVEQAYRLVRRQYYRPPDEQVLRRGAVRGMVGELDEYSTYVAPKDVADFQSRLRGVECGLGLVLERGDDGVAVVGPLLNSPAHHVGIQAGDRLLAIDGEDIGELDLPVVEERLRDCEDEVLLTVQRGAGWRKDFAVAAAPFELESVVGLYRDESGRWVYRIGPDDRWAYIRITEFVPDTGRRLREAIQRLGRVSAMVLDLRGNPGGTLPGAVEVANEFLRECVIATCISRGEPPRRYVAQPDGALTDITLVVLVDGQTASAAEIVAGALKLRGRSVVVGSRTRGKGYLQTMIPLGEQLGQINLTTAEMLVGERRAISRRVGRNTWGVDPHAGLEVTLDEPARQALRRMRLRAAALPATEERDGAGTVPATRAARNEQILAELLAADAPLAGALELLGEPRRVEEILSAAAAKAPLGGRTERQSHE